MGMTLKSLSLIQHKGTPWENRVLDRVDLRIEAGESIGVLGPSGSGKSMLLKVLSGLVKPTTGFIQSHMTGYTGIVFQEPHRGFFSSSVWEEVAFGPKNLKLSPDMVSQRVGNSLERVDLPAELWSKSPFHLSGGEQRRLAIASALAMEAEALLLDEPTTGLDGLGQNKLVRILQQLNTDGKTLLVVVSHDPDFLFKFTRRVLILSQGKILLDSPWNDLIDRQALLTNVGIELPTSLKILDGMGNSAEKSERKPNSEQEVVEKLRAVWRARAGHGH